MQKMIVIAFAILLGLTSLSANACPKGQHPYGGVGPHHNGGWCGP